MRNFAKILWFNAPTKSSHINIFLTLALTAFLFSVSGEALASPSVSAVSAVLIETSGGRILYEKNANKKMPMASTTKIATAICAIENSNVDKLIEVNPKAVGIEGSSIYLARGEKLTVRELLYGTMLNSGNDAATALAYEVGGSVENFAAMMNLTAKKAGAENTNFVNACGLYEDEHYTTAADLAKISAYALQNPLFAEIAACREIKISNGDKGYPRILKNHNKLLSMYEGCIGVKTGYTKKCGRCLVSAAMRNGVILVCVTLNAPDDWNDHKNLLDYGFSKVKSKTVAYAGDYCMSGATKNALSPFVKLTLESDLTYTEIADEENRLELVCETDGKILPHTKRGTVVGTATLYCNQKVCDVANLVCSEDVLPSPTLTYAEKFAALMKQMMTDSTSTDKIRYTSHH